MLAEKFVNEFIDLDSFDLQQKGSTILLRLKHKAFGGLLTVESFDHNNLIKITDNYGYRFYAYDKERFYLYEFKTI